MRESGREKKNEKKKMKHADENKGKRGKKENLEMENRRNVFTLSKISVFCVAF